MAWAEALSDGGGSVATRFGASLRQRIAEEWEDDERELESHVLTQLRVLPDKQALLNDFADVFEDGAEAMADWCWARLEQLTSGQSHGDDDAAGSEAWGSGGEEDGAEIAPGNTEDASTAAAAAGAGRDEGGAADAAAAAAAAAAAVAHAKRARITFSLPDAPPAEDIKPHVAGGSKAQAPAGAATEPTAAPGSGRARRERPGGDRLAAAAAAAAAAAQAAEAAEPLGRARREQRPERGGGVQPRSALALAERGAPRSRLEGRLAPAGPERRQKQVVCSLFGKAVRSMGQDSIVKPKANRKSAARIAADRHEAAERAARHEARAAARAARGAGEAAQQQQASEQPPILKRVRREQEQLQVQAQVQQQQQGRQPKGDDRPSVLERLGRPAPGHAAAGGGAAAPGSSKPHVLQRLGAAAGSRPPAGEQPPPPQQQQPPVGRAPPAAGRPGSTAGQVRPGSQHKQQQQQPDVPASLRGRLGPARVDAAPPARPQRPASVVIGSKRAAPQPETNGAAAEPGPAAKKPAAAAAAGPAAGGSRAAAATAKAAAAAAGKAAPSASSKAAAEKAGKAAPGASSKAAAEKAALRAQLAAKVAEVEALKASAQEGQVDARSVVVFGLPAISTEAAVAAHFGGCGSIKRCSLLKTRGTGPTAPGAYIEFEHPGSVTRALAMMNSPLLGCIIQVARKSDWQAHQAKAQRKLTALRAAAGSS